MPRWTADFTNDPSNDYELIIELLCDGEDVGVIKQGKKGLKLIWFAHNRDLIIPFGWLLELMNEVKTNPI